MHKLIMFVLLAAGLAGCASNQSVIPESEIYAQEELAEEPIWGSRDYPAALEYRETPAVSSGYAGGYGSSGYYPWWSVDYFYLSGGYVGSGIHFGPAGHYPRNVYYPYYNPRYRFAWYPPYYHDRFYYRHGVGWYSPYGYYRYRPHYAYSSPSHYPGNDSGYERYQNTDYIGSGYYPTSSGSTGWGGYEGIGSDQSVQYRPGDRGPTDGRRSNDNPVPSESGYGTTSQYVTSANGGSGAGYMVVRSREGSKPGRIRLHADTAANPSLESGKQKSSGVRYQPGVNEGKQRTLPAQYGRSVTVRPQTGADAGSRSRYSTSRTSSLPRNSGRDYRSTRGSSASRSASPSRSYSRPSSAAKSSGSRASTSRSSDKNR